MFVHTHTDIYIYIYIYICMCVCLCGSPTVCHVVRLSVCLSVCMYIRTMLAASKVSSTGHMDATMTCKGYTHVY